MSLNYKFHKPVLLTEMLENLQPVKNEIYVDATFGAGGYSSAILRQADCQIYAFDRDPAVFPFAEELKNEFGNRFHFIPSEFSGMDKKLCDLGIKKVDAVVFDLGVSSMQLDNKERGFSFNSDHKLDMRMDSHSEISAFQVVNELSESDLAKIIRDFGEEKKARLIAKKIIAARKSKPIATASELAEIIRAIYGYRKQSGIDPATKTFQAIRIFVNRELDELQLGLEATCKLLNHNGRLIVVSFHSLEDSCVKNFLRAESGYNDRNYSRYQPEIIAAKNKIYSFSLPKNSAIKPDKAELKSNPRARSARMRIAIKN